MILAGRHTLARREMPACGCACACGQAPVHRQTFVRRQALVRALLVGLLIGLASGPASATAQTYPRASAQPPAPASAPVAARIPAPAPASPPFPVSAVTPARAPGPARGLAPAPVSAQAPAQASAQASAQEATRHRVTGMVVSIDVARRTVLVSHDAIEGVMDAMTMSFEVSAAGELEGLAPGMVVTFTLVTASGSARAETITVCPATASNSIPWWLVDWRCSKR